MAANSESQMQSSRGGKRGTRDGKGEQRHVSKKIRLGVPWFLHMLPAQGLAKPRCVQLSSSSTSCALGLASIQWEIWAIGLLLYGGIMKCCIHGKKGRE